MAQKKYFTPTGEPPASDATSLDTQLPGSGPSGRPRGVAFLDPEEEKVSVSLVEGFWPMLSSPFQVWIAISSGNYIVPFSRYLDFRVHTNEYLGFNQLAATMKRRTLP